MGAEEAEWQSAYISMCTRSILVSCTPWHVMTLLAQACIRAGVCGEKQEGSSACQFPVRDRLRASSGWSASCRYGSSH